MPRRRTFVFSLLSLRMFEGNQDFILDKQKTRGGEGVWNLARLEWLVQAIDGKV